VQLLLTRAMLPYLPCQHHTAPHRHASHHAVLHKTTLCNTMLTALYFNAPDVCPAACCITPHCTHRSLRLHHGFVGRGASKQQSLAAVALSDMVRSALQLYGIPLTAVRHTVAVQKSVWQAPFFAQELRVGHDDRAAVLLIGSAAMQVRLDLCDSTYSQPQLCRSKLGAHLYAISSLVTVFQAIMNYLNCTVCYITKSRVC